VLVVSCWMCNVVLAYMFTVHIYLLTHKNAPPPPECAHLAVLQCCPHCCQLCVLHEEVVGHLQLRQRIQAAFKVTHRTWFKDGLDLDRATGGVPPRAGRKGRGVNAFRMCAYAGHGVKQGLRLIYEFEYKRQQV